MKDRREEILLRLMAILGGIASLGPAGVFRNRGEFNDKVVALPLAVLLDGTERKVTDIGLPNHGRVMGPRPSLVELSPQIFLLTKPKKLENASEYGPEISVWRIKIMKAIMTDAVLIGLLGANGGIDYKGFETDMQNGRLMEGQLLFNFSFRYPLIPSDL